MASVTQVRYPLAYLRLHTVAMTAYWRKSPGAHGNFGTVYIKYKVYFKFSGDKHDSYVGFLTMRAEIIRISNLTVPFHSHSAIRTERNLRIYMNLILIYFDRIICIELEYFAVCSRITRQSIAKEK